MTLTVTQRNHGTFWFDDVPPHWAQMRLKDVVEGCLNGFWGDDPNGDETDTPVIRVADFDRNGRRAAEGPTLRSVKRDQKAGRLLEKGDLLIEKSGGGELQPVGMVVEFQGEPGAVCSNFVARMRPREIASSRYLTYLHAYFYALSVTTRSIKQSTGIQNLDSAAYLGETCFLPPKEEQIAIAGYLDAETARIDMLIEGKEQLQALLQELKHSTLTKAIHEGLEPDAPMNDSGVSWFSKLPSHWAPMRLKRVIDGIENGWSPQCEGEPAVPGQWGVLKAGACNGGVFRVEENKALPSNEDPRPELEIKPGNVLMSRASGSLDLVGSVAFVEDVQPGLMLSDKIFRLKIDDEDVCGEWLALALNSSPMRRQIASFVGGAEGLARNIASGNIRELVLPLPPRNEQVQIVKSVKRDLVRIAELVMHVDQELELLRELRTSTITDAVLGRIDVRKAKNN